MSTARLPVSAPAGSTVPARDYTPQDRMFVFWLQDPAVPVLVGTLDLSPRLHGGIFRYADHWLRDGFSLSPDLPLKPGEFQPEPDHLPGAIDDARPDRWGERVIRHIEAPRRLSILEYLFFAGDDRFGALGISLSPDTYLPCAGGPAPQLRDVPAIHAVVQAIELGHPVDEALYRLIRPGATLGGAKPKALVEIDGQTHIVKFPERGEIYDVGLVEHATMTLAHLAGLEPAATRPIALGGGHGHAIAVQRFDRQGQGGGSPARRAHAMSLRSALRATGSDCSYPEFALHLRRYAAAQYAPAMERTVFRRMVFNILMDNTDDHEKNHALVFTDAVFPRLAPAFDMLPTCQNLGYQQIGVGARGAESSLENALSSHKAFRLSKQQALAEIKAVAQVVDGWQGHFERLGVGERDIEVLQGSIDRRFLREQREWALR
jgi:serine/threonine-protein kinase HipA